MPFPKTVKIEGKEFVVAEHPELLAHFKEVAKEEKEKLYTDITEMKQKLAEFEAAKGQQNGATNKEIAELKKQLNVANNEKKLIEAELKGTKTTKTEGAKTKEVKEVKEKEVAYVKELEAKLLKQEQTAKEERDKIEATLSERFKLLEKQQKDFEFSAYKKEVKARYRGSILPEFLDSFTSKEDLDKGLPSVIENSKKYIMVDVDGKQVSLAEKEKIQKSSKPDDTQQRVVYVQGVKPPEEGSDIDFSSKNDFSQAEFGKNRESIMESLKNELSGNK